MRTLVYARVFSYSKRIRPDKIQIKISAALLFVFLNYLSFKKNQRKFFFGSPLIFIFLFFQNFLCNFYSYRFGLTIFGV